MGHWVIGLSQEVRTWITENLNARAEHSMGIVGTDFWKRSFGCSYNYGV